MTPAQLAERATLGALLAQPRQLAEVAGWLRPSDFAHWWHAAVYRALLTHPRLAARGDPVATAQQVRGALIDTLGHTRSDPPGLHTLLRAAPDRPVAARYAAMVLEASIRRQVAGLAVHLHAAAVPALTSVPDHASVRDAQPAAAAERDAVAAATGDAVAVAPSPGSARDVTGLVEPMLAELGARWAAAVRATSDPAGERVDLATVATDIAVTVEADDGRVTRLREMAVVADRAIRNAPPGPAAGVRADAARLVAALVTRPDRIDTVAGWLRPGDVPGPARAVYEALLTLRQQDAPSDPVTVAWEVHRASRARGPGPDPALLLRQIAAAELLDVDSLTRAVAHDTLRRTAAAAADGLRAAAGNPGLTVGDVLDAAAWAARAVTRAAHDLRATGVDPGSARDTVRQPNPAPRPTPRPVITEASTSEPAGGRWRPARHLTPAPGRPDLRVLR